MIKLYFIVGVIVTAWLMLVEGALLHQKAYYDFLYGENNSTGVIVFAFIFTFVIGGFVWPVILLGDTCKLVNKLINRRK